MTLTKTLAAITSLTLLLSVTAEAGPRRPGERRPTGKPAREAPRNERSPGPRWSESSKKGEPKANPSSKPAEYQRPSESAGGTPFTWTTKNYRVEKSPVHPEGTSRRPFPQQHSKTEGGPNHGEHRFYDPSVRPPKEGAALASSPRKSDPTGGVKPKPDRPRWSDQKASAGDSRGTATAGPSSTSSGSAPAPGTGSSPAGSGASRGPGPSGGRSK
jgi:hypothetical protein